MRIAKLSAGSSLLKPRNPWRGPRSPDKFRITRSRRSLEGLGDVFDTPGSNFAIVTQ